MDPPADIELYSNSPSNTGQSSPTLSKTRSLEPLVRDKSERTFMLLLHLGIHVIWRDSAEKFNIFI